MKSNLIDNRQIRVFISSTFQDMQDERDYLMKHTFPVLRTLASKRDVMLTELDLRWGITEEESKSGKVVEICLREIENSIPFFIGIIGNRYGWVPEKKDISENVTDRFKDISKYLENRLSVTEMEMQFGVLSRDEDMHAYFYIKEGEEVDNPDNPEMLERLKREVKASKYPSSTYSSPEDLGIQVEQAFRTLLDQLFPEGHVSPLERERIGQRSFMNQLCQNYIRNDKNFKVLDEWFADWNQHQLVVTGASGLGKSALIANWLKEKLSDEHRDYNIIYHFTGNGGSESHHEYIMKVLSDEINDVYGWDADDETNKQLNHKQEDKQDDKLNDLFIKVASEGKKPLLIVLDAINQIVDTDNAKLLNWLPLPPRSIKVLFSTLEDDRTMEVFKNRHYPVFVLQPISLEHRRQLITRYLGWFSKKLTNKQVERIANDRQCENTLVIKTLLDELIGFGVYEKLDDRIEYYLSQDTIEEFYQALLKRFEEDFGEEFTKYILSLISVSRNGLSEDEILAITGYKPLYWSQFYCAFASHLNVKNGLISFSHRYVQEAIAKRYLGDTSWERSCRMAIIGKLSPKNNERAYAELPYQYDAVGDYNSLYQQLINLDVFRYQYNNYEFDLAHYWRKMIELGYDYKVYREILKASGSIDNVYIVADLFADYCSLNKFAQILLEDSFAQNTYYHYDTVEYGQIVNRLCLIYRNLANYEKALSYCTKAIKIAERDLGKHNPQTAILYHNIGSIYFDMGAYDKALDFDLMAMKIFENEYDKYNSHIGNSFNSIGLIYLNKGNDKEALIFFKKSLEISIELNGMNHPEVATSYNNIGLVYSDKGEYEEALEYYQQALKINRTVLGDKHPMTAISYMNIGMVYKNYGNFEHALEYYQKAQKITESSLGNNHPKTASLYNNMGDLYFSFGNYKKGLEFLMKSLEIREKTLGKRHPDIASSYNNIGAIYGIKGDYKNALNYYNKALNTLKRIYGEEHINIAAVNDSIGGVYRSQGDFNKALEYCLKALFVRRKMLGEIHIDIAKSYDNTANIYKDMGDYEKAHEFYIKAVEIFEKILGKGHIETAICYNNIGTLYDDNGNFQMALNYYLKSLEISKNTLGDGHPDTAISYENIAGVYSNLNNFEMAVDYSLKAVAIWENIYGMEHTETTNTYNIIAWYYHLLNKYDDALPYAEKAIKVYSYNVDYIDTIATIYQGLGRYDEALEHFELCLKLQKEQNASEESIQETEDKIADVKEKMKEQ